MDTGQLASCLLSNKYTNKFYNSVIPIDFLPRTKVKNILLIINSHDSLSPGEHWMALYIDKNENVFFFDSFAQKITSPYLINFLKMYKSVYYNTRQLQHVLSTVCGCWCAVFLYYMSRNVSFESFLKKFSNNHLKNDEIIKKEFKKIYNVNFNEQIGGRCVSRSHTHFINQTCSSLNQIRCGFVR